MKKFSLILPACLAIVALASCGKETPVPEQAGPEVEITPGTVTLTATIDPASKTLLTSSNKVEWIAGDEISVFDGTANTQVATADNGSSASFSAALSEAGPWYALYPYSSGASISGSVITTTLPSAQTAVEGTFADDLNIAVALSDAGNRLAFKNVLGLIKFTVGADADIVKVTLTGNDSETLAGTVDIDYNSGDPEWTINSGAAASIELSGSFAQGKTYYFAVLPQTFPNGITLTYTNSGGVDRVESSTGELVLGRSQIRNIGSPDIIVFADPDVKAALVAHFDTNGDGEISKAEAEAVTYNDFEALVGNSTIDTTPLWGSDLSVIDTFDELRYFTGLTNSSQSGRYQLPAIFDGCTNLTSVKIPDNIAHLSNCAFRKCTSLTTIEIPATVTELDASVFDGCSSLTSFTGGSGIKVIGNMAFKNCTSLEKLPFDATVQNAITSIGDDAFENCETMALSTRNMQGATAIGKGAFKNCKALTNLTISSNNYKVIQDSTFFGCSKLATIRVGKNITQIRSHAFNGCVKLTTFSHTATNNGFVLPPKVDRIFQYAFSDCRMLSKDNAIVGVPDFSANTVLTRIDDRAFRYCAQFKEVELPSSVTYVRRLFGTGTGTRAMSMTSLKLNSPAVITEGVNYPVFTDGWAVADVPTIYVPNDLVDDYKATDGWSVYADHIVGF